MMHNYNQILNLALQYRITDYPLLIKSGFVLGTVILMFFLHTFVPGMHVDLGESKLYLLHAKQKHLNFWNGYPFASKFHTNNLPIFVTNLELYMCP